MPVVISDACGGRDKDARARAYADFEFQKHAIVTDIATITPLLTSPVAIELWDSRIR